MPETLNWKMCQAVRIGPTGKIEMRSFPFFALSLDHARKELVEMAKEIKGSVPYTHIYSFGELKETKGKFPKANTKKSIMIFQTGEQTK